MLREQCLGPFRGFFVAFSFWAKFTRTRPGTVFWLKGGGGLNPGERHSRDTRDDGTATLCALRAATVRERKCARSFFWQTFWTPPGVRDIPAKFPGHPGFLSSKPKEDKVSRAGKKFSATTPSRGRPPPHRAVSGPKNLIFVLFFLAWTVLSRDCRADFGRPLTKRVMSLALAWRSGCHSTTADKHCTSHRGVEYPPSVTPPP